MFAVGARLKGIEKILDAKKDPMEEQAMECRNCEVKLAMNKLYYPAGEEGFACPRCNRTLELVLMPDSSGVAAAPIIREDLNFFFRLLREADEAYKAEFPGEATSWSYGEI